MHLTRGGRLGEQVFKDGVTKETTLVALSKGDKNGEDIAQSSSSAVVSTPKGQTPLVLPDLNQDFC